MDQPKVILVIPAYNEERILAKNILLVLEYLKKNNLFWQVIISDNASTDSTPPISQAIVQQH
ncbi:MAG: glycosyltransferase, partial [Candidatus Woesebacteria bacterium]|nr:glycosyltransferase [Candidatus Woesebacteria bacterium]